MSELVAGVDVGSGTTKCVLVDEAGAVRGAGEARTLPGFEAVAARALAEALASAGARRDEVIYVATTGLGRSAVPWRQIQITDVTCAARGAHRLFPEARFALDMGAQTTRAIRLRDGGKVADFHMNEKCAAGSGGFIERAARYLEVAIADVGGLSLRSAAPQPISSVCAVLAESEIINHVSEGRSVEDILRGIHASLAERAKAQLRRVGLEAGSAVVPGGRDPARRTGPAPPALPDPPARLTPRPAGTRLAGSRGLSGDCGRGSVAARSACNGSATAPQPGASNAVVLAGGVARQAGMVAAFREALEAPVLVPERPELTAALGAAVLGWQRVRRARAGPEPARCARSS